MEKVRSLNQLLKYLNGWLIFSQVLVDIPIECIPMLNEIIKLINPEFQSLVADVLRIVPKDIILSIIQSKPDSIRIIECVDNKDGKIKHVRYASLSKLWPTPECLKHVKWQDIMGDLRDQMDHDVCWAIVVSELIRAVRLIEKREEDPTIRYSPQDLIDFANPEKRRTMNKLEHYCYTWSINKGFQYVMENGIQREEDRPFQGCPKNIPDRASSQLTFIKDFVKLNTIEEAFLHLQHRPIGAALAMFHPEYTNIGAKIYRGPVDHNSLFCGLHAVSLVSVDEENGQRYVLARTSHGDEFGEKGYIKVALDVMLVYIPTPGEEINSFVDKYFGKPSLLLTRFSYPRLLTKEEEVQKKKTTKRRFEDRLMEDSKPTSQQKK